MIITRKAKINTMLSGMLLVVSVGAVVFGWSHVHKMGVALENQGATVASYMDREQRYADLLRQVEATRSEREELASYILKRSEAPDFVTQGERIAAAQGLSYTTDSLEEVNVDGDFDQLVVSFTMAGPEANVYRMLRLLETLPHRGDITSVQISKRKVEGIEEVQARVKLVVLLSDNV